MYCGEGIFPSNIIELSLEVTYYTSALRNYSCSSDLNRYVPSVISLRNNWFIMIYIFIYIYIYIYIWGFQPLIVSLKPVGGYRTWFDWWLAFCKLISGFVFFSA